MQTFDHTPFIRMQKMLDDVLDQILTFCENYLFCLLAMGLWIKIILGVLTGRTPSIVMVVLAIICSAIAVSLGAFFW